MPPSSSTSLPCAGLLLLSDSGCPLKLVWKLSPGSTLMGRGGSGSVPPPLPAVGVPGVPALAVPAAAGLPAVGACPPVPIGLLPALGVPGLPLPAVALGVPALAVGACPPVALDPPVPVSAGGS